ncbi:MAG: hypothetical protein HC819_06820 [Cyclobacteriaceae bacterium]|nr:hypothetical protein [Cyclobacteriaceae bacterium]
MIKKSTFLFFIFFSTLFVAVAQNASNPYSIFGIGSVSKQALIYNKSMGGLGISNGKSWVLNNVNPAMLPLNTFSTFDVGLYTEKRTLNTKDMKQGNINGGLDYLTLGIPLTTGKWTMSLGLMPYSNVSYDIASNSPIVNNEDANASYLYSGSGGINQVFVGSGWQIVPDFIYAGVRVGYGFGSIKDETTISLSERVFRDETDTIGFSKNFQSSAFNRRTKYSDLMLEGGLYAKRKLGKEREISIGLIYELGGNMRTKRDEFLQIADGSTIPPSDTLVFNAKGSTYLPQKWGVGVSFSKPYKWTVGMDIYTRNWENFKSDFGRDQSLNQSREIIIGGEYTPDLFSVKSYFHRITYQMGFNYEQTPVKINNESIDDFGINFGVSLPVGSASILNVGFKYGQTGTTTRGLIREDYFKLNLGMTFNDRSYSWYRNQGKYK